MLLQVLGQDYLDQHRVRHTAVVFARETLSARRGLERVWSLVLLVAQLAELGVDQNLKFISFQVLVLRALA